MSRLHSHTPAIFADVFHSRQLILAHMSRIHLRCSTEGTGSLVSARIAQMPRIVGHGTARFTGVSHIIAPFRHLQGYTKLHSDAQFVLPAPVSNTGQALIRHPETP